MFITIDGEKKTPKKENLVYALLFPETLFSLSSNVSSDEFQKFQHTTSHIILRAIRTDHNIHFSVFIGYKSQESIFPLFCLSMSGSNSQYPLIYGSAKTCFHQQICIFNMPKV